MRARARPQRAVVLERVEQRDRLGYLELDRALPLPRVEVDAEALERRLDPLEHDRNSVAVELRELRDVIALVAVLGRLLAAPRRLDGLCETLHLSTGVVVVVLALDLMPREREHASDGVAVRPVPRSRDRDGPGRVRRDHLDLNAFRLCSRSRPEAALRADDLGHAGSQPRIGQPEVDESRSRSFSTLGESTLHHALRDLPCDLSRRTLLQPGELQRDVRRVVAVLRLAGTLERDGSAGDRAQLVGEPGDRVS